jgi:23S rRNA pseudouridine2605 synthase
MAKHPPDRGSSRERYRAVDGRWRPPRPEGLARLLARAGYGARPRTEAMVRVGRVQVDGQVVTDPGLQITGQSDVLLDGAPLCEAPRRYLALNKPAAAESQVDGSGWRGLAHLLPADAVGLEPSGRLDTRTGGLLLISNDLDWNRHASESATLERCYEVLVTGQMNTMVLDVIEAGILLPNRGLFQPHRAELLAQEGSQARVLVALRGDHVRKIRAAFGSLLFEVVALTRVSIGPVCLGAVPRGCHRELTEDERRQLTPPPDKGS